VSIALMLFASFEGFMIPAAASPRIALSAHTLRGFFAALGRLRLAHKAEVVELGWVRYTDGNALVRQKVVEAVIRQRAPLLNRLVRQGIDEGVFTTTDPDHADEVIMSLLRGMENTHAWLLLSLEQDSDKGRLVERAIATHGAYMEAIERVLDAPPNAFDRADAAAVRVWADALGEEGRAAS
jgi:hypothetical protein